MMLSTIIIRSLLYLGELPPLRIGQDGGDFAVKSHPFNRQIRLGGGYLRGRGADGRFVRIAGADGGTQDLPRIVQLAEQRREHVLLAGNYGLDLFSLARRSDSIYLPYVAKFVRAPALRRRGISAAKVLVAVNPHAAIAAAIVKMMNFIFHTAYLNACRRENVSTRIGI